MGQGSAQPRHVGRGRHASVRGRGRHRLPVRLPHLGRQPLEGSLAPLPLADVQDPVVGDGK